MTRGAGGYREGSARTLRLLARAPGKMEVAFSRVKQAAAGGGGGAGEGKKFCLLRGGLSC